MAVLIDHTYGILYNNEKIRYTSWFSVALFILISGITTYKSRKKNLALNGYMAYWQKISGILNGYCVATALYLIAKYKCFDFEMYMDFLVHFNASGPLYLQFIL